MRRMVRREVAGLALTIAGVLTMAGFAAPPPATAAGPTALTDPTGDVINRDTNAPLTSAATDIVAATVDSGPQGIVLSFTTAQMGNPGSDPNWASPDTFVSWQLDSTGDGKVDDLIRYSADRTTPGGIISDLTHWSAPGVPAKHCDATAGFDPVTGYTLTFAQSCIGNPAAISYRVQLTYNTQPSAAKPPLAFDVAPDQGLAGPVPIFVPVAPAAAPPPAAGAPGAAPAPTQGAPATPATTPKTGAAAPAKAPVKAPAKAPAKAAAPATKAPASATPATTAPGATPPAPGLAATGSNAHALGALGGLFLALGGLGLMAPGDRRRRVPAGRI